MNVYDNAKKQGKEYFNNLNKIYNDKFYVNELKLYIKEWGKQHNKIDFSLIVPPKTNANNSYKKYINWLKRRGKLNDYLDRSISYIYMRDLGADIDTEENRIKINKSVESLKKSLINKNSKSQQSSFTLADIYKKAKENHIEDEVIWLLKKLKSVKKNIPKEMNAHQSIRKVVKVIMGVVMHQIQEFDEDIVEEEKTNKFKTAIYLGYSYGLTYPFIDDLFDSKILTPLEEENYSKLIEETLTTGVVPELGEWCDKNKELIQFIHSELCEAFYRIKSYQDEVKVSEFLNKSYIFFKSQDEDRRKNLEYSNYSNEDLFVPIILKSAYSRLIVRTVINAKKNNDIEERSFYYGIYNQLADDFTDMFEDNNNKAVTPYTYFKKYKYSNKDIINPFELYWVVIYNLIHNVYKDSERVREIILDRAVNSLKRFKTRLGAKCFDDIMELYKLRDTELHIMILNMVNKSRDVDFFDKLLRDNITGNANKDDLVLDEIKSDVNAIRDEINNSLKIKDNRSNNTLDKMIVEASNYSIDGSGKRLRPIISWYIGKNEYGLSKEILMPIAKSIEYMHTASLIYDDLPSQDNANMRRGRITLHEKYNTSIAELSSLYLTQLAIEEQTNISGIDERRIVKLINYTSATTQLMCRGQAMDLNSKGKKLTLEDLKTICFYKTGIAFEAALIMPSIMKNLDNKIINKYKKFAYHAGIAYQIKDDILDVEGNNEVLGKIVGMDKLNGTATFVSILGKERAEKEMWEQYILANDVLNELKLKTKFLKYILDYIVNRER